MVTPLAAVSPLSTLLSLKEAGDVLPALVVLLSPWTDLEGTGESMETRAEADPWLKPEASRATPVLYIGEPTPMSPSCLPDLCRLRGTTSYVGTRRK